MTTRLLFITISITLSFLCHSQKERDSLITIWENTKLEDSTRANAYRKYIIKNYKNRKTDSAYALTLQLLDFTDEYQLKKQKALTLILLGEIEHIFKNNSKATDNFNKSLKLFKELNDKRGQAMATNGLGVSYRRIFNLDEAKKYFEKTLNLATKIKDTSVMSSALINIGVIYGFRYKTDEALKNYNKALLYAQHQKNKTQEATALVNIADTYIQKKDFNKALETADLAISIGDSLNNSNILAHSYSVTCRTFFVQKKYDSIIKYAQKLDYHAKQTSNKELMDGTYYFLKEAYKGKKDFDSTMKYHELRKNYRNSLADIKTSNILERIKIDDIRSRDSLINANKTLKTKIEYQNEKTNLTLAWGGSLSAVSIFAFLIFRNSKRKQRKAEEERQKQIEEKEKILKDLELSTIDAMIQGQEKERQKLASDLHDSVGATLSAAKLQFNHLIKDEIDAKVREKLIKKTSTLLEDAYVEIRSMAHLKNAGVMAKNGLLPAVEKLTDNASGIEGLSFEVQSFGLDQRLDNRLEISIFRIIQELVTNIIKHANATKGAVHLTNHDYNINIMVEDNGKGFNPNQITKTNDSMGISSIDKRVEHLDGKLTIESQKNKGTTIIIDIPL